jgi:uncharacterized membrane protein YdbT with pleckstrin-like domain
MRYPRRLLTEDEEVVRQFRPHWRVLLPSVLWAMLVAALAGATFAATDARYGWIIAGVAAAAWLVLAGRSVVRWWFTSYVLTTERIIVRAGMIARSGTEIPLESINNVLFRQSIRERLLGYGDVTVESAGRSGRSRLVDIPDPEAFQSEIYRARELRSLHFRGAAGTRARDVVEQLEALADLRDRGHLDDHEFRSRKARILAALPGVDPADVEDLLGDEELDADV